MDRIFGILIKNVSNDLNRDAEKFAVTLDLTRMQMSIIDYIARNENDRDIFQKDIEKEFNIRRASATSALKLMEKKDLLVRVPPQKDARLKRLILTTKSRQMTEKISDYFETTENMVNQIVGAKKISTVKEGLTKISDYFNK